VKLDLPEEETLTSNKVNASNTISGVEKLITLSYSSSNEGKATGCEVTDLINLTQTFVCSCDTNGLCQTGVTPEISFVGEASFNYIIKIENKKSNISSVSLEVEPNTDEWPLFEYNIFIGLQDTSLNDLIYQLNFENSASLSTALSIVDSFQVNVANLKSISMNKDGNILMGGGTETTPPVYSTDYQLIGNLSPIGATQPETNSHTICALPNGNYIIAEESTATANIVNEYDSEDNFVRTVYSTVLGNHSAITQCYAPDNKTLIMVESEAWALTESNLLRMSLSEDLWEVEYKLNSEVWDAGNDSNFWSFIYHTDGFVYFPSFKRNGTRFNKMLKCPNNEFTTSACSIVGDAIPNAGTGGYLTWARGGIQIPGSNDMLVFLSQEVLHYNYTTGTYTSIMDLTATVTNIDVVRTVILAPK
jgi:hypothetical protein